MIIAIFLALGIVALYIYSGYTQGKRAREEYNKKGYTTDRLVSKIEGIPYRKYNLIKSEVSE